MVYSFAVDHPWDRRLGFWWVAEQYPDQPAVVASPAGEILSFAELAGRAHTIVHGLRSRGLRAGDIVAYALPNGVDIVTWQLAAQEGGFQSIALNPGLTGAEIRAIVDHSEAAAIVVHHNFADRTDELTGTGSIRVRVAVGGELTGWTPFHELVSGQPDTLPADRTLGVSIS
jgi:long-chain acyl-CoA synthetase